MKFHKSRGITLFEVVTVTVVFAVLVEFSVAIIQQAREVTRKNQCENNLRQIGQAVLGHVEKNGCYPTGGWGWFWLGDPDRGRDRDQPGSWEFCILDYFENIEVPLITKGLKGQEKAHAIVNLCAKPMPIFTCPSRREAANLLVIGHQLKTNDTYRIPIHLVARSDYAINTGDFGEGGPAGGDSAKIPTSIAETKTSAFSWYDTSRYTGISFGRSEIRVVDVSGGTSKTYLVGEKSVQIRNDSHHGKDGDDVSMYSGFCSDNGRSAAVPPQNDHTVSRQHYLDGAFGSMHTDCWLSVYCDGSVHRMSYATDQIVHKKLANRSSDKNEVPDSIDIDY